MIDKSSLLKSQGSLYLEFIPKDGLFHKMLLLSLMGFLTGCCNLKPCPISGIVVASTPVVGLGESLDRYCKLSSPISQLWLMLGSCD